MDLGDILIILGVLVLLGGSHTIAFALGDLHRCGKLFRFGRRG